MIETNSNNAPIIKEGENLNLKNYGYEPAKQEMIFELEERNDYPKGSGLPAYNIFYNGNRTLNADKSVSNLPRPSNMLLHVGGIYFNPQDNEARPIYSLGCIGIVSPTQINQGYQEIIDKKQNLSNKIMASFSSAVEEVKNASLDKSINLKIEKRGSVFQKSGSWCCCWS